MESPPSAGDWLGTLSDSNTEEIPLFYIFLELLLHVNYSVKMFMSALNSDLKQILLSIHHLIFF